MNILLLQKNLITIKSNYRELESKINMFTEELPRIQGQMEMLDGLTDVMEQNHCHMTHVYPNSHTCPHVFNLKYIKAAPIEHKKPDNQLHCLKSSKINTSVSAPIPVSRLKFKK